MSKVYLYIAATLDSYIASPDGSIDWLKGDLDYGYNEFIANIDTVIMGRKTYEQVLTFGDYPYSRQKSFILASAGFRSSNDSITIISEGFTDFAKNIAVTGGNIWIVGGAATILLFTELDLIDEYIIFTVPMLIGNGIPLFNPFKRQIDLDLVEAKRYDDGIVLTRYIRTI